MNSSYIYLVLFVLVRTYITDYKTSPRDVYVGLFWVHLWTCPHAKMFVTFHFFFLLISLRSRLVFLSFSFQLVPNSLLPLGRSLGAFYKQVLSTSIFSYVPCTWDSGMISYSIYSNSLEIIFGFYGDREQHYTCISIVVAIRDLTLTIRSVFQNVVVLSDSHIFCRFLSKWQMYTSSTSFYCK